jgi:hypothetical protein
MTDTREDTPRYPTSDECTNHAIIPIPGRPDTIARAAWWPQMGGSDPDLRAQYGDDY